MSATAWLGGNTAVRPQCRAQPRPAGLLRLYCSALERQHRAAAPAGTQGGLDAQADAAAAGAWPAPEPAPAVVAAGPALPTQGDAVVAGVESIERQLQEILKPPSETDLFAEFLAIQNQQPRNIGFFGTRNMGFMHQQLIEVLAYAMVLTGNHIFTSGATGTNAAVIRGALRAETPELLTVVLPQSLHRQPAESRELLQQVQNVIEMPHNDGLQLLEASRICNRDIIGRVQQVICFAFHDSNLLLETCQEARGETKIVTLFYLD
eukprot:scaffold6.g2534.t1